MKTNRLYVIKSDAAKALELYKLKKSSWPLLFVDIMKHTNIRSSFHLKSSKELQKNPDHIKTLKGNRV